MGTEKSREIVAVILEEDAVLTLSEFSRVCAVQSEWVVELVQEGILEPLGADVDHWQFEASSLRRAQAALRLQRDLGI
ncbi:MAG: chaperone modulator CbpM, partial [Pseudomonadota bacterium]